MGRKMVGVLNCVHLDNVMHLGQKSSKYLKRMVLKCDTRKRLSSHGKFLPYDMSPHDSAVKYEHYQERKQRQLL